MIRNHTEHICKWIYPKIGLANRHSTRSRFFRGASKAAHSSSQKRRPLLQPLNFQKCAERGVLCTFWLPNVLRATMACNFFDIWTSKSGPNLECFVHFGLETCFAPQWCALFRHLNFQKVIPEWCALHILTWKCASGHTGVQFFISHLASWLRTRRFSKPTCRPSRATNH